MDLIDIPFLKYNKILNKIWSTIQWEGLDKGIFASKDMWKYAKYEISEKDSADLRAFEYSAIEKYMDFRKEIKKMFDGKFVSIVNYDEGNVYIVTYTDNIVIYDDEKKEPDKKDKKNERHKREKHKKFDYERSVTNLTKSLLELHPFLHDELMRLYNIGLNDRYLSIKIRRKFPEINFGVNKILRWRKINKLPANKTMGIVCKIDERVENMFLDLYNQGYNDLEVGIILGVNPGKITDWRSRNNLRANIRRSRKEVSYEDNKS